MNKEIQEAIDKLLNIPMNGWAGSDGRLKDTQGGILVNQVEAYITTKEFQVEQLMADKKLQEKVIELIIKKWRDGRCTGKYIKEDRKSTRGTYCDKEIVKGYTCEKCWIEKFTDLAKKELGL